MSEQANVELIRAAYAAFKRGDIQSILDSLSKNVEWVAAGVQPVAGTYRGKDEVGVFFNKVNELAEYLSFEPNEYVTIREADGSVHTFRVAQVRPA